MKSFGEFEILAEIGIGSAARVYEAIWRSRKVALKVFDLGKHVDDRPAILRQFDNEVAIVRLLDHPNIVRILDAAILGDSPYMAMELMDAGTLEARLRSVESLNVGDTARILEPIADAVDYAHAKAVLHRDLKPSNVLFDSSGRVVVSDFSVAKFLPSRDEQTTRVGYGPPGTADFLAPEVLSEAPHSIASDLYSLALTVYVTLTGRLPTDGRTLFTRSRDRVEGKLVPVAERNPAVEQRVSQVVMRGLTRRPGDRFSSAREFAQAFRKATAGTVNRFDVFLCHNSADKPAVRRLNRSLKAASVVTWLDEEQLPPGLPWQPELEKAIAQVRCAVVCVGNSGTGPWQDVEIRSLLAEFVNRGCRVIPVLLPDASTTPDLPLFLRQMTWIDLRRSRRTLKRLVAAIKDGETA